MYRYSLMLLIASSLVMTSGCAMKSKAPVVNPAAQTSISTTTPSAEDIAKDEASLRAPQGEIVEETVVAPPQSTVTSEPLESQPLTPAAESKLSELVIVPFAYDQHLLSEEARNIILANAAILNAATKVNFQLAGHCDERGSDQYNIALGERRAEAVRSYLIELGIAAGRMETVSFGEERPLDAGHDESAWMQNRRVEFVLLP